MLSPSIELSVVLLVVGLCVLVLELFIPSAGMLFAIALVCVVGSVIVAFLASPTAGLVMLAADVILALVLPGIGIRLWQKTPIGRRMFLDNPRNDAAMDDEADSAQSLATDGFDLRSLLGETGRAITPLRPSGTTDFQGRRVDTVSEGVMIERGRRVRVVAVEGRRVVVREVE